MLVNRVCMVRIKDERFRKYRPCKVVAMFELLGDLLSISAIFVSSCVRNKMVSLRMFLAIFAVMFLTATD